ncbi:MAG: energy-coupling factor transporter transmembrane component T [bacterium]|nr:energy-coupling factor transporter transmembrane component T [bacterium]
MNQSQPIFLGHFCPLDSPVHQIDARAKMIAALAMMLFVLVSESILVYLMLAFSLLLALKFSGLEISSFSRNLKPVIWLVVITVLFHLLFAQKTEPFVVNLPFLKISRSSLYSASFFSIRLLIFILISFALTLTTSPSDMADGFSRLIRPLRRFRLPVEEMSLILFMAMRFIPVLYEEFHAIRNAQIIRGADFSGTFRKRVKGIVALVVPLLVLSINRADELAMAITVRGYRRPEADSVSRTLYTTSRFSWPETLFLTFTIVYLVSIYLLGDLNAWP